MRWKKDMAESTGQRNSAAASLSAGVSKSRALRGGSASPRSRPGRPVSGGPCSAPWAGTGEVGGRCSRSCPAAGAAGIGEVDIQTGVDRDGLVVGQLHAAVPGGDLRSCSGNLLIFRDRPAVTVAMSRPSRATSTVDRVDRSTTVVICVQCWPSSRSPSQCPGMARVQARRRTCP